MVVAEIDSWEAFDYVDNMVAGVVPSRKVSFHGKE